MRGYSQLTQHGGLQQQQLNDQGRWWCPEDEAGWVSKLLFGFVNTLLVKGQHLEQKDLWDTCTQDEPARVWGEFEQCLAATARSSAPKGVLWRALCRVHARVALSSAAVKLVHDLLMFCQPYILEVLLHHLSSGARDRWIALGLAAVMLIASLLEALTVNIYFNMLFRMSLHTKTQLLELLYRKALRISSAVKASMGVGPIMNLQSNDAAKLWTLPSYFHMLWNGPFQILVVMAMLVRVLTLWPALAGLGMTVAIIPLTAVLGKLLTAARKEAIAAADARVKLTTEVITGIKAIKLMAWEEPYLTRITQLRDIELAAIRKSQLLSMINSSVFNTAPVLVSLAAFGTYAALGHPLTAAVAFPSLALFNLLRFPIVMIPQQIFNLISARVGITRIQEFLDANEMSGVHQLLAAPLAPSSKGSSGAASTQHPPSATAATAAPPLGQHEQQEDPLSPFVQQQPLQVQLSSEEPDVFARFLNTSNTNSNGNSSSTTCEDVAVLAGIDAGQPTAGKLPTVRKGLAGDNHSSSAAATSSSSTGSSGNNLNLVSSAVIMSASASAPAAVSISRSSFSWAPDLQPVLHDIDLHLSPGQLVMIVGPVGSGKSSLLAAVLGELLTSAAAAAADGSIASSASAAVGRRGSGEGSRIAAGFGVSRADGGDVEVGQGVASQLGGKQGAVVTVAGSVAYTAQDPWIQNATLRDNILMGLPYDAAKYQRCITACCLDKDLQMLPAGDASEIGEKGINLSGGQKHRVALARAVYSSADVLLLDDPLSAVDAHVGRALFDGGICGQLAGRTRLLVSHQLQYLPRADLVLVMLGGRIAHKGTFQQLTAQGIDLSAFVPKHEDESESSEQDQHSCSPSVTIQPITGAAQQQVPQQQQQQLLKEQPPPSSLLAADSQQLGGKGDTPAGVHMQSSAGLKSGDSAVQLVQLPSYVTKGLVPSGGSYASHVPAKCHQSMPTAAAGATGPTHSISTGSSSNSNQASGKTEEHSLSIGVVQQLEQASATAATPSAAAGGGSLGPPDGDFVSLQIDSIQPPAAAAAALVNMQQEHQQQLDAFDSSAARAEESLPLIPSAEKDTSDLPQQDAACVVIAGTQTCKATTALDNAALGNSNNGSSAAGSRGQLVLAEKRAKGQVKRSVYLAYLTAMGPFLVVPIAVIIGAFGERGLQVLQNLVLSLWSNHTSSIQQRQKQHEQMSPDAPTSYDTGFYLTLYFILGLSSVGVVMARSALLVVGSIAASRRLHSQLLKKLLRLPMSFFDSQPTGRLINRFTKDTEAVDTQLSAAVNSALSCLVAAVLSIVVVVAVSPLTVLVLIPLMVLYYRVQALYLGTSRELKRLDALAFSPIFQHYAESLNGLPTIRAFQRQQLFIDTNRAHIIQSNRAWWPIQLLNRWLSMRLELTGAVVVFAAAAAVGTVAPRNAGLAGLALTSALNLTGTLAWMVRQVTELEVNMNAVERVVEWRDHPEEADRVRCPRPPPNWPHAGQIQAVQLTVRYRPDLPPVIKALSFNVSPGEKIGICGRTGCGKSTLMLALFRIVEPCGGAVVIDGLDTATLGLTDLRARLSLVPQDPVVFSGSFRSNLDPFSQAVSDSSIWEALRQAGLDGMVRSMGGLDANIQEGGLNLSGGQRQLLCMARALLRSSRILVLDEATSNVDQAADAHLQATLRRAFARCTVLTIAHRLNTISDADRVMVLDQGQLREFDAPAALMKLPGGLFRGLMEEAGRSHA